MSDHHQHGYAPSQSAGAGEEGMSSRMEPPYEIHTTEIRSTLDVARHDKICLSYIGDAKSQQSCNSRQAF